MNATIQKFGYPATLVREYEHWLVLARPAQGDIGLAGAGGQKRRHRVSPAPASRVHRAGRGHRRGRKRAGRFCGYERINYLMLMMVDPHVHFHVIPRYSESANGVASNFPTKAGPDRPISKSATDMSPSQINALRNELAKSHLTDLSSSPTAILRSSELRAHHCRGRMPCRIRRSTAAAAGVSLRDALLAADLDPRLVTLLEEMPHKKVSVDPRRPFREPGVPRDEVIFVRSGILCKYKTDGSGRRQIVALRFQGEGILPHEGLADYGVQGIVRSEVLVGKAADLDRIVDAHPELCRFFWRLIQRNESISYEWLVNCGRRTRPPGWRICCAKPQPEAASGARMAG